MNFGGIFLFERSLPPSGESYFHLMETSCLCSIICCFLIELALFHGETIFFFSKEASFLHKDNHFFPRKTWFFFSGRPCLLGESSFHLGERLLLASEMCFPLVKSFLELAQYCKLLGSLAKWYVLPPFLLFSLVASIFTDRNLSVYKLSRISQFG